MCNCNKNCCTCNCFNNNWNYCPWCGIYLKGYIITSPFYYNGTTCDSIKTMPASNITITITATT